MTLREYCRQNNEQDRLDFLVWCLKNDLFLDVNADEEVWMTLDIAYYQIKIWRKL